MIEIHPSSISIVFRKFKSRWDHHNRCTQDGIIVKKLFYIIETKIKGSVKWIQENLKVIEIIIIDAVDGIIVKKLFEKEN